MRKTLKDIAGAESLERFNRAGPVLYGLPAFAYTDADYWALECEHLFRTHWMFVGLVHELQQTGDVVPVDVGGKPIFLIRNRNGDIKAFQNACRHRCLKIIDRAANVGPRIRCPYHSWVYSLDGELRSTPFFGGPGAHTTAGFDLAEHNLLAVHCAVWHDWIFVNLSDAPTDFNDYIAPLAKRLADAGLDSLRAEATVDFGEIEVNWKLLMENFIEPYHVQYVHASTTKQPLTDHYTIIDGHCLGSAVDISKPVEHAGATLAVDAQYLTLFPNFVFGLYADQLGVHINLPVSWDRTRQRRVIYSTEGCRKTADEIEALKDLWRKVHAEDHHMCRRMQQGKASDVAAAGGRLSPHWETSVRRFQELALAAVDR